jgi:hypothetical protein
VTQELPQPGRQHLSTLTALLLLTFFLVRFVELPTLQINFALLGLLLGFELNTRFFLLTLAALLAASGSDWLIHTHPTIPAQHITPEAWVIPGLAALGTGVILTQLPFGPALGIGLALTALLLIGVLVAEFIVQDPADPRHDRAALGLTAMAYLLLVGVLFAMRAAGLRALFAIPLTFGACYVVAWRQYRLEDEVEVAIGHAALFSLLTSQIAWALHYWPMNPLQEALILSLLVYLGCHVGLASTRGELDHTRALEVLSIGVVALVLVLFLA